MKRWQQKQAQCQAGQFYIAGPNGGFVCDRGDGGVMTSNSMKWFGMWCKKNLVAVLFTVCVTLTPPCCANKASASITSPPASGTPAYTPRQNSTMPSQTKEKKKSSNSSTKSSNLKTSHFHAESGKFFGKNTDKRYG